MKYLREPSQEWQEEASLKDAVMIAEAESERHIRAGFKVVESDHSRGNYYLEVFDNGAVVEFYFDI